MTNSDQEGRIMPVQRLGWGFLLAWVFCTFYTDIAADALGSARMDAVLDPWVRVVGSTLPVLVAVAVLVALVAGERRWGPLVLRRGVAAASSAAAAVGTPLLFSSAPADLSQMAPFVFGALLTGGGSACLWVLWGACYARLPQEEVERCAPVSAVLAALLILAASAMSGWVAVVFVSLLPVVSAACALASWRELDSVPLPYESAAGDARLHPQAAAIPRPTDALRAMGRSGWGILVACLFVCVEGGFYGGNRSSSLELQAIIVASALFMVGIGLYSVAGPRRVSVAYLFRWMCPLLVAGFAALVVAGASQVGALSRLRGVACGPLRFLRDHPDVLRPLRRARGRYAHAILWVGLDFHASRRPARRGRARCARRSFGGGRCHGGAGCRSGHRPARGIHDVRA